MLGGLVISGLLLKRQLPDPGEITYRNGTLTFPPALFADRQTRHLSLNEVVSADTYFLSGHRSVLINKRKPQRKLVMVDCGGRRYAVTTHQTDIEPIIELLRARGIEVPFRHGKLVGRMILVYIAVGIIFALILTGGLIWQLASLLG